MAQGGLREAFSLQAAKAAGRGAPLVIATACLALASASSLPAIPWWSGTQSRVVLPVRLLSMRLKPSVSTEPLWIAFKSDWLSVHMAATVCDGKSHSSAMRMAAFSSPYDEVIGAPHCCFVRGSCGFQGLFATIPAPPFSVSAVAKPSL